MKLNLTNRFRAWLGARRPWLKLRQALRLNEVPPVQRKIIVGILGTAVLLAGVVMIILPGPAILVIPLGLAILATEFFWARRLLRKAQGLLRKAGAAS